MNKQEILAKINELQSKQSSIQAEIAELKLQAEKLEIEKPNPRWVPKHRETYYLVSSYGGTKDDLWNDHMVDKDRLSIGNVFKTKEEAEFEIERLKVIAELKEYASEFVAGSENRYFYYDHNDKIIGYDGVYCTQTNNIYFPSKEIAQQAVEAVGEDRVKKYYLGVKD